MSYIVLGIDPGISGASVFMASRHKLIHQKHDCSEHDLAQFILSNAGLQTYAFIEKVASRPGQGVRAMFTFGQSYGFLRGMLVALDVAFEEVSPQRWQKAMGCRTGGDKKISYARAQQLFPHIKITHKIADAILIAEYGRRVLKERGDI